jgi:hypothetical protein
LIARFINACRQSKRSADWFRRLKQASQTDLGDGIQYVRSPRHAIEVEHFSYRRRLQKIIAKLS